MKKILLTALTLVAMTCAYAGVEGAYNVVKYAGVSVGSDWKMSDAWSSEDPLDENETSLEDRVYQVTITDKGDGVYEIYNLLGRGETVEATLDGDELSIAPGTLVDEEKEVYIMGGTQKYSTVKDIVGYLDSNHTYINSTQVPEPVTLTVDENGNINLSSPLVIYYAYEGYIGYARDVYEVLEMCPVENDAVKSVEVDSNVPVEYYNLQGMRIANPDKGQITIRRQGGNVAKIVF